MSEPGWHPDPMGRFAQRWYDGDAWTDAVMGDGGAPGNDPIQPVSPAGTGDGPAWVAPVIAGIGAVLVALGLFALDWVDGGTFSDLRDSVDGASAEGIDGIVLVYVQWLVFVAFAGSVVAVGAAAFTKPAAGGRTALLVVGSGVAAVAVVLHGFAVARLYRGEFDPEFGAWAPVLGYLVMVGALVIGGLTTRPGGVGNASSRTGPSSGAAVGPAVLGLLAIVALAGTIVWGGGGAHEFASGPGGGGLGSPGADDGGGTGASASGQGEPDVAASVDGAGARPSGAPSLVSAPDLRDLPGGSALLDFTNPDLAVLPDACTIFTEDFIRAAVPEDRARVESVSTRERQITGSMWRSGCDYEVEFTGRGNATFVVIFEHPEGISADHFEETRDGQRHAPEFIDLGPTAAGGNCYVYPGFTDVNCKVNGIVFGVSPTIVFTGDSSVTDDNWLSEVIVPIANNIATRIVAG